MAASFAFDSLGSSQPAWAIGREVVSVVVVVVTIALELLSSGAVAS